jgi:uncharacterized protein YycO
MIQPLDIVLFKGYWWNPLSWFIAQRTSCFYTHGGVMLGTNLMVEAKEGGVQKSLLSSYGNREHRLLRFKGPLPEKILIDWLLAQVGKPYEYKSYLGYVTGLNTPYLDDPDQFVCVELASEMFTQNGIEIWGTEKPTYIYPSDLLQNGNFKEVT